jgi:multiple sugar transport system permease protein
MSTTTTARAPLAAPSAEERSAARTNWLRAAGTEAKLLLVGIPVLLWTVIPIYHLVLFAISPKQDAMSGALFPAHPTLQNFKIVFGQQFWNSAVIAFATGVLTLVVATAAAFAISRLKVKGGRTVMNMALFTYFIPAAFLAVPMYKTMGAYGLLNSKWALILAMVTIASPYAIWVLKQASDNTDVTLPVALGSFLAADDSPWELLMTTGLIYALPPAAIYYVFKRYMVGGLTAGAVKS